MAGGGNRTTYYVSPEFETMVDEYGVRHDTVYVFVNGERLAEVYENGSRTYYLNDHLGSSSVLIDELGHVVDRVSYYPFGDIREGGNYSKYGYNSS